MDINIEKHFIDCFIVENAKERFLYELASTQKRNRAIQRFAHSAQNYLVAKNVTKKNTKMELFEIESEFKKDLKSNSCYVICGNINGETMPITQAVECCMDWLGVSLIISNNTVFIKEEQSIGSPMKYLLHC